MKRFIVALLIGGVLGAVVGLILKHKVLSTTVPQHDDYNADEAIPVAVRDSVAWHYVSAYQEGDWSRVLALTLWIEERLDYIARTGSSEDVVSEREALIERISNREIADNQLRNEGVEDQYVFVPGARVVFVREDEGRDDLEAPVGRRTWFNIIYPAREKALLDREGLPIRSVLAGINVSEDGRVLKAGVVGNLDIDWDSIHYDWSSQ